jgi:UDP-N-acetylmuramyl pentapeptide phosphotransferase/UDP-N-acetylglucosamine-1-phosphate transferase
MMHVLLAGALTAFVASWALVLTQGWHGRFTLDSAEGVQKFHLHPTPRVGGLSVMAGLLVVQWQSPADWMPVLGPMLLAALPAFVVGVAEDLSKSVGPGVRLLCTVGSGVVASVLTGTALTHTGLPWLDGALQAWWPLAVAFTAFAVGGVANAVNIVDGFNGLASGLVMICLCALGAIALQVGDGKLAGVLFATAAVVLGFLAVNFPLGKIFLGDGGAYVLGFWLAWLAVLLIERNAEVSAVAVLLACAYPVVEVAFSVARRIRRAHPAMHPDRLHLHSLVKCRLVRKRLGHWPSVMQNASVSPLLWLVACVPAGLGAWFWNSPAAAWIGLLAFALAYALIYRRLALFRWR